MRRNCRLWWPEHLSTTEPLSSTVLFGWFISNSSSFLDIVVAFGCDEGSLASSQFHMQGILYEIKESLPIFLRDKYIFSMLGHCAAEVGTNLFPGVGVEGHNPVNSIHCNAHPRDSSDLFSEKYRQLNCGCHKLDGSLRQSRLESIENNMWIQLVYGSPEYNGRKFMRIPQLFHMHWNQQMLSQFDLHVIFYESSVFGGQHFSLGFWNSCKQLKVPSRKPKWVQELHQTPPLLDLDAVILAINSSTASELLFERHLLPDRSVTRFSIVNMFCSFTFQLLAVSTASVSTMFYVILQLLHVFLCYGSNTWIYIMLAKLFSTTWKNIRIRCCQFLYWPILLQDYGLRSRSCVEYTEKAALHEHSMLSSLAADILFGNLLGMVLLLHTHSVCHWISCFANDITNCWLRTGCVWLMGVPAGFKLNTELAGVLGMISLNTIQIWSTLWYFVGFLIVYFIKGLAISGILFGLTTPAALIIDMLSLVTLHLSTLHWIIALFYSLQMQAITALWRLFRGRKWNPLRQRFDSYEYNVEQHIVGSLVFTPLLLLLPTTSVFYIFFTITNSTVSFISIILEVAICVIHATPYSKIFLWLIRPRRFPSGVWFQIIYCQSSTIDHPEMEYPTGSGSPFERTHQTMDITRSRSSVLVSFLRSNYLNLRDVVCPHYRDAFSVVSWSFIATSMYGVLTGKSIPSTLGVGLPSTMTWISIPHKDYWRLCRDAVLAARKA